MDGKDLHDPMMQADRTIVYISRLFLLCMSSVRPGPRSLVRDLRHQRTERARLGLHFNRDSSRPSLSLINVCRI